MLYEVITLIKAISNGIAVYSCHTNADAVLQGVNGKICELLQLQNCRTLDAVKDLLIKIVTFVPEAQAEAVRNAIFEAGAGHIGQYDCCSFNTKGEGTFRALEGANPFIGTKGALHSEAEIRIETVAPAFLEAKIVSAMRSAHPYEEVAYDVYPLKNRWNGAGIGMIGELVIPQTAENFLQDVKQIFRSQSVRYAGSARMIRKVAVCGGSGNFLISKAKAAGADIFITGEMKYHDFFGAEGIILADIGHFESEQFTTDIFIALLIENFSNFAIHFTKVNSNPIKYL